MHPSPLPLVASRSALVVFGRSPVRETEKPWGLRNDDAMRLAAAMVARTVEVVRPLDGLCDVVLVWDGIAPQGPWVSHTLQQRGADFAARMEGALADVFALGYARVLVVGTDTPDLQTTDLRAAVDALAHGPVIGPAVDGGVSLFGVWAAEVSALADMPWTTRDLAAAFRARFGTRLREVRRLADVDTCLDVAASLRTLQRWVIRWTGSALQLGVAGALWATAGGLRYTIAEARSWSARGPPLMVG